MFRKSRSNIHPSRHAHQHKERSSVMRRRRLFFEVLEDRRVLACTGWAITTNGFTISASLSVYDDDFWAGAHTDPNGAVVVGIWNEGDAGPCWTSAFLALNTTSITVDALAGNDEVYLHLMGQTSFPNLTGTTVSGGTQNDLIWGSWAPDLLKGDGDEDTIKGFGNNDDLRGGTENDILFGGLGDDEIQGNEHNDTIYGEEGNDGAVNKLQGNDGNDKIFGGPDNDRIDGGANADVLFGEAGVDQIWGSGGSDNIEGGDGDDNLMGDDAADSIQGGAGNDSINGGNDADVLWSDKPVQPPDQPWDGTGPNPTWYDMDESGPDNDGACDIEDFHDDLDGTTPCPGTLRADNDEAQVSHSVIHPGVVIDVLDGDFYTMMPPLPTVNLLTPPAHGSVGYYSSFMPRGFPYNPDDDYATCHDAVTYTYCYDVFTYNLTQGGVTSNTAAVIIKITNQKPIGVADSLATVKNTTSNPISPVTNDIDNDPYDDPNLKIAAITDAPDNGSVSVSPDGKTLTYTPHFDYVGNDEFYYTATDGLAVSGPVHVQVTVGAPLMLDLPPAENGTDVPRISQADLALLAGEAARRWVAAGVDPITAEKALAGTEFVVADLPGSALGMELPGTIVIDVNAAGYGWFIDATPSGDEEFSIFVSDSERRADSGAALGKADLLTVLMHEFGHALGMVHDEANEHSVMHDTLGLSMRRLPTAADILAADEFYASLGNGSTILRRRW